MRKILPLILSLALLITMMPQLGSTQKVHANTGSFVFPQESTKSTSARTITDPRITLTGAITGVDPSTISYSIYQIVNDKNTDNPSDDLIGSKRENLTTNIYVNGFTLQVYNVELFTGLNQIVFKGMQGGGEVTGSIYIEYHDGPVFSDLIAQLDGNKFPVEEASTTVVSSAASAGKTAADISITGSAPNAQQVTIEVNGGNSKTYNVSSSNNYQFAASPIRLQKGKNLVTIKVKNATQTIVTNREIAFYNGDVTFYDLNLYDRTDPANATKVTVSEPLEFNPNFTLPTAGNASVVGTIIVPNHIVTDTSVTPNVQRPNPDPSDPNGYQVSYSIKEVNGTSYTGTTYARPIAGSNYTGKEAFFIYEFQVDLSSAITLGFKNYVIEFLAENYKKSALTSGTVLEGTGSLGFSLSDSNKHFINAINYLPGYINRGNDAGIPTSTGEALTGSPLEGVNLYGAPFAMEVLVGNANYGDADGLVEVTKIENISGKEAANAFLTDVKNIENVSSSLVNKFVTIDGKLYKREIIVFKTLPFEGTQTVTLDVDGVESTVKFTMLFGPFVNYTSMYDTMIVYDDSLRTYAQRVDHIIKGELSNIDGSFNNMNDISEISYGSQAEIDAGKNQTVFFYINNTPIKLVKKGTKVTDFTIEPSADNVNRAFDALFNGENEIKFVYQGSKNKYEKIIKVFKIPTNVPIIPVNGTTVYPYATSTGTDAYKPIPNDSRFTFSGGVYTTNEEYMNVFGTFDFLDFNSATSETNAVAQVQSQLNAMTAAEKQGYILEIKSTSGDIISWNLTNELVIINDERELGTVNPATSIDPASNLHKLVVRYDMTTKTFSFIVKDQRLNIDGSSSVYTFTVYNSGTTGPKATYRLEVDPTSMPYSILRPFLPAQSIVNQNFVEVIINAEGADSVVINKQTAELIEFDSDNDPSTTEDKYNRAFRVFVRNLKVGSNKIDFTIKSANDEVKGTFTVTYAPTNIPGAQYLQTMSNNHKIFDGALNLKFDKGTTLIRTDYNVPQNLKNQVFTGHDLLFGIANGEDGVVNRREHEDLPAGFDIILESFGTRFRLSYPTRFTKASPVYWIDAGLADDPGTGLYDPQTMGVDPYQFSNAKGTHNTSLPTYDERPDNRELITSKEGTLTLAFDPNMRDSIGTIITVFRYDVKAKYWENLGGVVDTKKNTITVPFSKFGYYVVGKMVYGYTDMISHPYARNHLEAIFSKGIMNPAGYDDYGSNLYVSRGEFARMMVKALDIPLNYELSTPHFDDVPAIINPDALWDYRYVETAAREGIIRGTGPRTFSPGSDLSRQDAAVIIARALDLKLGTDISKVTKDLEKQFKDAGKVEYYAKASVAAIAKKDYIKGSPVDAANPKAGYVFEPESRLLRSDAAIIVSRILADLKKLPDIF